MDHNSTSSPQSRQSSSSIHLQISDLNTKLDNESVHVSSASPTPVITHPPIRAPEKKLTLFALRLAVLEKTASGIGTLGFIWATVVLLGGFAITLETSDFWFVTIILLIEGTRIFSRSHELEWQHNQSTWTLTEAGISSFRAIKSSSNTVIKKFKAMFKRAKNTREMMMTSATKRDDVTRLPTRTWTSSEVPLLPYVRWAFVSKNVSKFLYWLQLASATACMVLSTVKLIRRDFGEVQKGDTDKRNRKAALLMFYSLALAEALLFLLEKAYWEWKVSFRSLLEQVSQECELGRGSGLASVRRFFYDAYSKCVNGSIFDGLKMDMVSFSMELLGSDSLDEQLIGLRILRKFCTSPRFSDDTLQKIGISLTVMERLVEMLNWKDTEEEEVRYSAAEILLSLASKRQNSLRIAGIPASIESISGLLHVARNHTSAQDHISEQRIIFDGSWALNHLGLKILKKLARDHDICGKIGHTRGLLPKIIDFLHAEERLLKNPTPAESQIETVKRSLQVLKMLASTSGASGEQLRRDISDMVFTISYIRDILRHGEKQPQLRILAMEILKSLAIEEGGTERIVSTGGVVKELFNIFFDDEMFKDHQSRVRTAAGEALSMLSLQSRNACRTILKLRVIEKLRKALEAPLLCPHAARIVRNLCIYSGDDSFEQLKGLFNRFSKL